MGPIPVSTNHTATYRDEHLTVDFEQQSATLDAERMLLTRKEYDLLALLVKHAGEIIPREALLMRVWSYGSEIRTRTLDVHVRRLRKNLGSYSHVYVETIFGVGYRFQPYRATPVRELAAGSVGTPAVDASPASWRWKMAGAPAI